MFSDRNLPIHFVDVGSKGKSVFAEAQHNVQQLLLYCWPKLQHIVQGQPAAGECRTVEHNSQLGGTAIRLDDCMMWQIIVDIVGICRSLGRLHVTQLLIFGQKGRVRLLKGGVTCKTTFNAEKSSQGGLVRIAQFMHVRCSRKRHDISTIGLSGHGVAKVLLDLALLRRQWFR
jgi:hypothetical protein